MVKITQITNKIYWEIVFDKFVLVTVPKTVNPIHSELPTKKPQA